MTVLYCAVLYSHGDQNYQQYVAIRLCDGSNAWLSMLQSMQWLAPSYFNPQLCCGVLCDGLCCALYCVLCCVLCCTVVCGFQGQAEHLDR